MIKVGKEALVVGNVQNCNLRKTRKRSYYQVTLNDGNGNINLIWFHALSWITGKFEKGDLIAAYGKVDFFNGFNITHPEFDVLEENDDPINTGQIISIYPGTSELKQVGLESRGFRRIIRNSIDKVQGLISDYFTINFLKQYGLMNRNDSILNIHQPIDMEKLQNAIYRLKFDETISNTIYCRSRTKSPIPKKINYYNILGQPIKQPIGTYIESTTYEDGTIQNKLKIKNKI